MSDVVYYLNPVDRELLRARLELMWQELEGGGISEELRGYNVRSKRIQPPEDEIKIPLWEVAGEYCPTGRDVYLRHVLDVRPPPSPEMLEGWVYHRTVSAVISEAKRFVYKYGKCSGWTLIAHLKEIMWKCLGDILRDAKKMGGESFDKLDIDKIRRNMGRLWSYEACQMASSIDHTLATQPYAGIDALIANAIPVITEYRLDGRFLGLSGQLSVDALGLGEVVIFDLKTGPQKEFHRLYTTGYALVFENVFKRPVDIGCVVYVSFKDELPVPRIKRDLHLIDDALRSRFLEARDEKMAIISEERDPGIAKDCPESCPYRPWCLK